MPMIKIVIAIASLETEVGTGVVIGVATGDGMTETGGGVQGAAQEAVVGIEDADCSATCLLIMY